MIKYFHIRSKTLDKTKGGITYAIEVDDNDIVLNVAAAVCHPKDNFCKAIGRTIATGRLNVSAKSLGEYAGMTFKAFVSTRRPYEAGWNPNETYVYDR